MCLGIEPPEDLSARADRSDAWFACMAGNGTWMATMTMLTHGLSNLLRDALRKGLSECFQGLSVCYAAYLVLLTTVSMTNGLPRQGNSMSGSGTIQAVSSSAKRLTLAVLLPGAGASDVFLQQSRP
ncbi:MAG: hypothetical protein ACYS0H_26855, partial [Planctomycetota bacterium]